MGHADVHQNQVKFSIIGPGGSDGGSLSPRSAESTYNAQLGTEYAHDSTTGELYLMEHASDWWEAGPNGPGYYKALPGGGYRQLTQGLGQ